MINEKIEREVQKAMNAIDKPFKYIGRVTTITPGLLAMEYELAEAPFTLRVTDDSECVEVKLDADNEVLIDAITEDIENVETYLNRAIYQR